MLSHKTKEVLTKGQTKGQNSFQVRKLVQEN